MQLLLSLMRLMFGIVCLRNKPQDVPESDILLWILLLIYCGVALLLLYAGESLVLVLLEIAFEIIVLMAFTGGLLWFTQHLNRYRQVLAAFLGTDALLSFIAIPAMLIEAKGDLAQLITLGLLALMIWHWVVCGHIIRYAISASLFSALGIALFYIVGSYQFMGWFAAVIDSIS